MTNIYSLTCPSCGGKLQITSKIDRFACEHCGNEHIVRRSDGVVTLSSVIEGLIKVQQGEDKTASELAIVRQNNEIYSLQIDLERREKSKFSASLGPTRFLQKLLFRTPLVIFPTAVGEIEQDYLYCPLKYRFVAARWRNETTWGKLFREYQQKGTLGV